MTASLSFDRYQFHKRPKVMTAESRITWQDYQGMHSFTKIVRRSGRYIPPFSATDVQLRESILQLGWTYLQRRETTCGRNGSPVRPPSLAWIEVARLCQEKFDRVGDKRPWFVHAVRRARGYLPLIAAVAYRSWRLKQDAAAIAEDFGVITPSHVRQIIQAIINAGKFLGFECAQPHPRAGTGMTPDELKQRNLIYQARWRRKATAAGRMWWQTHRKQFNATMREWRRNNPERSRATHRRYRENHPEKVRALVKRWQQQNAPRCAAKAKAWRDRNPEKAKQVNLLSRTKSREDRLAAKRLGVTITEYRNVWKQFGLGRVTF